jgi:hypothetical protein
MGVDETLNTDDIIKLIGFGQSTDARRAVLYQFDVVD